MLITVHCSRCGFQAVVEEPLLEGVKRSHAEWCDGQLEHVDVEKLRKVYHQAKEYNWCYECNRDLVFCECMCPTCGKNQFECDCSC